MTHLTQADTGAGGNTSSPAHNPKGRHWCFTLNNYTQEELDTIDTALQGGGWSFVMGREVGENGTPHIQGYITRKNPTLFSTIKKWLPRAHIERAKGNAKENFAYCTKQDKNASTNMEFEEETPLEAVYDEYMEKRYKNVEWKPWQNNILEKIKEEPEDRTIHWYWEAKGCTGKSFLTKYIDWKDSVIIVNGKQSDVFNGIATYINTEKKYPRIVIIDIPRTHKEYVCYSTMEKIKDGLMYSGKYEGSKIRLLPTHLIVFANFAPDTSKMSEDRWDIREIS